MKLTIRVAGVCGSGTFLFLACTAYFSSLDPMKVLSIAVPGAVVGCVLGYLIGQILSHPQGKSPTKKAVPKKSSTKPGITDNIPDSSLSAALMNGEESLIHNQE